MSVYEPSMYEPRNVETSNFENMNPGTPEPRNPGTSAPRNLGTPEPRHLGTSEPRNFGTSVRRYTRSPTVSQYSRGTVMPSEVGKPAWNAMKSVRRASRRSGSRLAASARVGP